MSADEAPDWRRSAYPHEARDIVEPTDALMQLPKDDMIALVGEVPPIRCQKLWFDRDRRLKTRVVDEMISGL
jgi:type IV secretory pathway TraG/TraD family ATPase VirD4